MTPPTVRTPTIHRVAIVGGGYMGGGIAQSFALSGLDCTVADIDEETSKRTVARLIDEGQRYEANGLFPAGAAETLATRLSPAASIEDAVAHVDYVAEAVPERLELKVSIIKRISAAAGASTIIGSNTSAIPIGTLAQASTHPEWFLGVHWMNPSYFVPSVEIIPAATTSDETVLAVETLLNRIGKVPTRVTDSTGFVANRLQYALFKEAVSIVEEGLATPEEIDEVVSNSFGFRLAIFGPFAISDIAGLDVYESSFRSMEKAFGERMSTPTLLRQKVEQGQLGLKSGAGFLEIDPAAAADIAGYRDRAYFELNALKKRLGPAPL
jgi:3-hydroxybutyryl-CoA dehydrogenase